MSVLQDKPDLMEKIIALAKVHDLEPNKVVLWSTFSILSTEMALGLTQDTEKLAKFMAEWTELCEGELTEQKQALLQAVMTNILERMESIPKFTLPKITVPATTEKEEG